MATVGHAFSPKEFQLWVASDATNSGTSGIHASNMHQLDVDSVGFPSLNVTQALDVRSGVGATLKDEDFFQDNKLRVVELSISGTLHDDVGHRLLLANICGAAQANDTNQTIASGHKIAGFKYGAAVTNNASSLTVVIKSSDHLNQRSLEMAGCVVTNFSITADAGTEGGRYKWSATLQTGKKTDLESIATPTITAYANTTVPLFSSSSVHKVSGSEVVMNSFTATVDSPAVFTGATSTGYQVASRGAEIAVTADTQIKYDGNTKAFIHEFGSQTSANSDGNMFAITNNNAFGVNIHTGLFTNVALSEGDLMMLDCSVKAVDGGEALITFDVSA